MKQYLPPATKLGQGYVFTRVCDSVHRGGVGGVIPAIIAGGISACLAAGLLGGGIPACFVGGIPACIAGLQGGVSRPTQGGGVSPGPHPGGLCIPACTEADPPWTATTMGGTHSTGMHSCTRKHSSRMPTICCTDRHGGCTCPGGVSAQVGVYLPRPGGLPAGVCTCQGCVPAQGVYLPRGCTVGGVPASVHAGIHTPRADTPIGQTPPLPGGHCSGR